MGAAWAASVPRNALSSLGVLRLDKGILCREHGGRVWLRGEHKNDTLDRSLRCLPGVDRYGLLDDGRLVHADSGRVPVGRLPAGEWTPIAEFIGVEIPPPALPGECGRARLALARSKRVAEANVLVTALAAWRRWVSRAPAVRLGVLRFAVSTTGDALVRGSPLPPIRGRRFVETSGVAVPAGWTWTPAVDAETLRELLALDDGDLALLDGEAAAPRVALISAARFERATRSAVRLTEARQGG